MWRCDGVLSGEGEEEESGGVGFAAGGGVEGGPFFGVFAIEDEWVGEGVVGGEDFEVGEGEGWREFGCDPPAGLMGGAGPEGIFVRVEDVPCVGVGFGGAAGDDEDGVGRFVLGGGERLGGGGDARFCLCGEGDVLLDSGAFVVKLLDFFVIECPGEDHDVVNGAVEVARFVAVEVASDLEVACDEGVVFGVVAFGDELAVDVDFEFGAVGDGDVCPFSSGIGEGADEVGVEGFAARADNVGVAECVADSAVEEGEGADAGLFIEAEPEGEAEWELFSADGRGGVGAASVEIERAVGGAVAVFGEERSDKLRGLPFSAGVFGVAIEEVGSFEVAAEVGLRERGGEGKGCEED